MPSHLHLNAFLMNCVSHLAPGQWVHPDDRSTDYLKPSHWVSLAQRLEAGLFDGVFLGDVLGVYDVDGGSPEAALASGAQVPMNDPFALVPLMAHATQHLGIGITASATYEAPYLLARRFTTLDHLSGGRVAWNIVTSYLRSGARSLGLDDQVAHDERYDRADDFLALCYRFWEGSWSDTALRRDRERGVYAEPSEIRAVDHDGPFFRGHGVYQCEPSPQRTPLLFQAGGSARGLRFAARHAESVFAGAPTRAGLKRTVDELQQALASEGRDPQGVPVFGMFTAIVDPVPSRAQERLDAYRSRANFAGARALLSGWTGVDLSRFRPDEPLAYVDTASGQSALASFSKLDPGKVWTVRDAVEFVAVGGRGPVLVGTPEEVADQMLDSVQTTGIRGFNLASVEMPRTFEDIVQWLVPELQRRGVYKTRYAPGTWREKLLGQGPRALAPHPAALARHGR